MLFRMDTKRCFRGWYVMVGLTFILSLSAQASPILIQPRSNVVCVPVTWLDVLMFMFINYVLHAITVKSLPGETASATAFYHCISLLFPFTGAWRGLRGIKLAAIFGEDDLHRAARAGALCIVARSSNWKAKQGDEISGCIRGTSSIDSTTLRSKSRVIIEQGYSLTVLRQSEVCIHGQCCLPRGYHLVRLPEDVAISRTHNDRVTIASTHSSVKVVASVFQLIYAIVTLYRAGRSQLDRYGYASFALTVIPYAIMSLVNLVGNFLTPDYLSLYIVKTEVLVEAESRGGRFDGTIGIVKHNQVGYDTVTVEESWMIVRKDDTFASGPHDIVVPALGRILHTQQVSPWCKRRRYIIYLIAGLICLAPYIIIGALTRFDSRSSTGGECFWPMAWLVAGQVAGALMAGVLNGVDDLGGRIILFIAGITLIVPAIGGFVTVGKMMKEFGNCVELS
jgi:hypothetical protein